VKGFLLDPVATFRQASDDKPCVLFSYFGALLLLNTLLSALVAFIPEIGNLKMSETILSGPAFLFLTIIFLMIAAFILTIIVAAWVHLWVYIFGGRKGILQTLRAVLYGNTPYLLLGWIPLVGIVFALWSIALGILGVRELQEMSTQSAVLAVAAAIITLLIPLALLATWLMTSNMVFLPVPFSRAG
jgi:hypothetical protein